MMKKIALLLLCVWGMPLFPMDKLMRQAAEIEHDIVHQGAKPKPTKMDKEEPIKPKEFDVDTVCAACCMVSTLGICMPFAWTYDKYQELKQKFE